MDDLHIGTQSVRFDAPPSILSFAAIGGKKEQEGPLASYFDFLSGDTTFGQKSWEKAESELQKRALDTALHRSRAASSSTSSMVRRRLIRPSTPWQITQFQT